MPDVLVVGAGIIGCTVADALSARGAAVHVLDPRAPGEGATQASGGMLAPHAEGVHAPALEALGVRSLAQFDALVTGLVEATGRSITYARTGSMHVASDEAEAAELEALAAAQRERGVASTLLPVSEARQFERELAADAAVVLFIPAHGFVGARDLARAAWDRASARGARLTVASVTRIERGPRGGVRVVADEGTWTTPSVVLAAGCWAGSIAIQGAPPLPVRPIRGQLLHLRWPSACPSRIVWGARCYTVPWPDGTVLAGATTEDVGFDERATVTGVRDLLDAAAELLPRAWLAGFSGVRVGLRPASPDDLPIVGPSTRVPGLVYATGHYRNGVLLAPLTAELVAKAVAGDDDPAFAVTTPSRFGEF
jgi:glycine oxidase